MAFTSGRIGRCSYISPLANLQFFQAQRSYILPTLKLCIFLSCLSNLRQQLDTCINHAESELHQVANADVA
jgi:hypothetical protein